MFLITGMHRSGTSCVTGILHRCGLSLGTTFDVWDTPAKDNAKGHYENSGLVRISEKIFKETSSSWYNPPPRDRVKSCASVKMMKAFSKIFNGDIAKDPRATILIDFYILNCATLEKVVHCVRHPLAVAKSLYRRNKLPEAFSKKLWLYYNQYFLNYIGDTPVLYVSFDKLLSNLEPQMQRILNFLGRGKITSEIFEFVDSGLNHHPAWQDKSGQLEPSVLEVYYHLMHKCELPHV
ncbi:MAG: hypothetical protein PVI71_10155 [Desulfobacterales bacterium]|jgi:hypothetical protein